MEFDECFNENPLIVADLRKASRVIIARHWEGSPLFPGQNGTQVILTSGDSRCQLPSMTCKVANNSRWTESLRMGYSVFILS
jgi:hypothetical protein